MQSSACVEISRCDTFRRYKTFCKVASALWYQDSPCKCVEDFFLKTDPWTLHGNILLWTLVFQLSYHKFNETQREPEVLKRLQDGEIVALVSDAGTPGISDPGTELVSLFFVLSCAMYVRNQIFSISCLSKQHFLNEWMPFIQLVDFLTSCIWWFDTGQIMCR